ncbi:hypothetical protein C1646_262474 [Rhizophagus diaphanus]|nr:hypothetical protein C1646_262474 [Rhizophagus diaphanus] [Rhizophagus sp. MUCL 43196]
MTLGNNDEMLSTKFNFLIYVVIMTSWIYSFKVRLANPNENRNLVTNRKNYRIKSKMLRLIKWAKKLLLKFLYNISSTISEFLRRSLKGLNHVMIKR